MNLTHMIKNSMNVFVSALDHMENQKFLWARTSLNIVIDEKSLYCLVNTMQLTFD